MRRMRKLFLASFFSPVFGSLSLLTVIPYPNKGACSQAIHVVLFIMLYKVVLTCKSVDETQTLVCDHSNESYGAVLSCDTVYYAVLSCCLNCTFAYF